MTFESVNSKVVKAAVTDSAPLMSRRGAMLGYTGNVSFAPVSGQGGAGGFIGRSVTGEQQSMMLSRGSGEVFYGFRGLHQHVIELNGAESLTVESDRLLVHDANLTSSIIFLGSQGGIRGAVRGAVSGQGLFTTQLSGRGSVSVLAHGGVFEVPVNSSTQVRVDPQAYIAHKGDIQVDLSTSVGWREAVGRGSGEAFQLKLQGTGTVYVQASEEKI